MQCNGFETNRLFFLFSSWLLSLLFIKSLEMEIFIDTRVLRIIGPHLLRLNYYLLKIELGQLIRLLLYLTVN